MSENRRNSGLLEEQPTGWGPTTTPQTSLGTPGLAQVKSQARGDQRTCGALTLDLQRDKVKGLCLQSYDLLVDAL